MAKKEEKKELSKEERLDEVLKMINKKFVTDSSDKIVNRFGDQYANRVPTFSSGSLVLDSILGGGIPKGRIVEIYGPEASGKTSIALTTAGNAQREGETVAFIDFEYALDPRYAKRLGVNMEELIYATPDYMEQGMQMIEDMANTGAFSLIVVDSIASMVPKVEWEGELEDQNMAVQARILSRSLKKLVGTASRNSCTIMFINQIREKVGFVMGCLSANTMISLVDGRSFTMKELVEEQVQGEVLSLNEKTGRIESKKIVDWHDNGELHDVREWVNIKTGSNESEGTFTRDHELLSEGKWKKAKELTVGDTLTSYTELGKDNSRTMVEVPIVEINPVTRIESNEAGRYDITVEDNHNYFAGSDKNGFLVHNSPETTPGGRAMKFYASQRIVVRRAEKVTENGETIGNNVKIRIDKNKVGKPFGTGVTVLTYGQGILQEAEIISNEVGVKYGIIEKRGASIYEIETGERIAVGAAKAIKELQTNRELFNRLSKALTKSIEEDDETFEEDDENIEETVKK